MIDTKTTLRVKYREIRKNIKNKFELEKKICDRFLLSDLYRNCDALFLYSAIGSEVNIDRIIQCALSDRKKVALPVCLDENGTMEFYFIKGLSDIKTGMYGISEPIADCSQRAYSDSSTVCLVPGLCFDRSGGRLGYGKGYYDRFLEQFKGTCVGICLEACIESSLVLDTHDKTVDYLITDKKTYIFSNKEE